MKAKQAAQHRSHFLPRTQKARGYLAGVALLALPIYFHCVYHSFAREHWDWLYLGLLALLAGFFPWRLFSLRDKLWLTLSDVFVFIALFQYGVEVAVVVASLEALSFNLRRRPLRTYRWIFNISQIVLVAFLVGQVFYMLHAALTAPGQLGTGTWLLPLVAPWLCGFIYYVLSSGLTGIALAFSCRQPFTQVWMQNLSWFSVSMTGAGLAALTYFLVGSFVPLS
jgi:hypothetical protein